MSEAHQYRLRLLAPDQEAMADAVVQALLNGSTAGVPEYLADDIAAVRSQSNLGAVTIEGDGGVSLDGFAARPLLGGPHPLIVMPAGLDATGWKMYAGAIIRLLMRGYAVVAYTERGLPGSGGDLTVAGPEDVADGLAVIKWAIDNSDLNIDENRIGMAGISYGSGISQLVANNPESKVKAVAALSTWADLGEALYDNDTRHILAATALGSVSESPSAELVKILADFQDNTNIEGVLDYAKPRSPAQIPEAELRPVPTFFTSFWHETIFPQNQLLAYFDRFPGPKRLDLAVGDHGAVEIPGLMLGVYTRTTEAAYDWLDHYVREQDNDITRDGVVHTESMHAFTTAAAPDLRSWSLPVRRYHLAAPNSESTDGTLTLSPPPSFGHSFQADEKQVQAVEKLVMDGFAERLLMPKRQRFAEIDRAAAGVWTTTPVFLKPQHIAGIPHLELTVTPSTEAVTLVAYLFDHNPFTGAMRIITHAATTVKNQQPNHPSPVRLHLQATDYRIPVLHRLVLVIDPKDPLYGDETDAGATIALSAGQDGAYIDIPMTS
ncbi:CocE/NonD family hydrolase [Nocardia crassostreae]|uniref:CocE/NonD family hydrolase n=1 Tax=Nocardia crassostreae TaxID=53428 RepID=UPI000A5DE44D|nr:CocE/NonD family hydrolase [Nocardia crassostreae]